jgi:hypothetical protein
LPLRFIHSRRPCSRRTPAWSLPAAAEAGPFTFICDSIAISLIINLPAKKFRPEEVDWGGAGSGASEPIITNNTNSKSSRYLRWLVFGSPMYYLYAFIA